MHVVAPKDLLVGQKNRGIGMEDISIDNLDLV